MKILIPQNLNGVNILRKCSYGMITGRSGQSFVRRLARNDYPRFHVYIEGQYINLHLDQKQASYEGFHAHSGEYDGDVVEREGERIVEVAKQIGTETFEKFEASEADDEKKGFWGKMFG